MELRKKKVLNHGAEMREEIAEDNQIIPVTGCYCRRTLMLALENRSNLDGILLYLGTIK